MVINIFSLKKKKKKKDCCNIVEIKFDFLDHYHEIYITLYVVYYYNH